jgi:NRAMP (natural resistance-associated macrophage protein)-like metal ion transporter
MRAADLLPQAGATPRRRLAQLLAVVGPGLVVMLADIEAGSVITLAQSGAQWGFRLLLLQILLIPLMFMTQELTVRLGLSTGKGYGELVRQRFGGVVTVVATAALLLSCFGALITEMSGLVGAGSLFGVPPGQTLTVLVVIILGMVLTGSYHAVERVVVGIGLFCVAFVVMAVKAHPDGGRIVQEIWRVPVRDRDFLYLVAANIGTSIMPWMVFYQQSALINKGLNSGQLRAARIETMVGAILCQTLSVAVLVASASSLGAYRGARGLENIAQIGEAFGILIGPTWGKAVFAIGLSGGALVATIVVCLTAAWAMGEAVGVRHSLEQHPLDAPWFYGPFAALLIAGALLADSGVNLIHLSIAVGVANALLLPPVFLLLFLLARRVPPEDHRLKGFYALVVGIGLALTAALGLYAGIAGSLG